MNNSIYIDSVLNHISEKLDALIASGKVARCDKIFVLGTDKISFSVRTLLSRRRIEVFAYVEPDDIKRIELKRQCEDFSGRFLNSVDAIIRVISYEEIKRTEGKNILLIGIASKNDEINRTCFDAVFTLYDGADVHFMSLVENATPMNLEDIKQAEKEILYHIDRFCTESNLQYWVCGGTQLGAVRHRGFIPWDDDIDIYLPYRDWMTFLEKYSDKGRYRILKRDCKYPGMYPNYFPKLIDTRTVVREDLDTYKKVGSVWVDIFPLVGLPDDAMDRKLYFRKFYDLEKSMWSSFYKNDGCFFDFPKFFTMQDEMLGNYDFNTSEYVGVLGTAYIEKDCTARSVYDSTLRMPFEDIEVNVPYGYDEYLSNLYGSNYLSLPPSKKRVSGHHLEAYYLGDTI